MDEYVCEPRKDKQQLFSSINLLRLYTVDAWDIISYCVTSPLSGSCSVDGSGLVEKSNLKISPKSFVATEICDGKSVISFSLLVIIYLFSRT